MTVIGVFDSGTGGLSVANAVKAAFPGITVRYVNDREHLPYGIKTKHELLALSLPLLKRMQDEGCNVIVVACNSLTTNVITELRANLHVPLVAIEPMVKPAAAMTRTGVIAVCATPATLASPRYNQLKLEYTQGVKVIEPDCSNWAMLIENKSFDRRQIVDMVNEVVGQGADVIVLGCTHYHWIEEDIKREADNKAQVIQPEQAIIRRLQQTLGQLA